MGFVVAHFVSRMANYFPLDPIFRALADPTRRLIIEYLCDADLPVTRIAEPLPMALGSVLKHLRVLEKCGLIRTHKIGQVRVCWIEPRALELVEQWVRRQHGRCEHRLPPPWRRPT